MKPTFLSATALLFFTASVATAQDAPASDATTTETEPKEITDRRHPDYVRCKSERVIGSLSKRRRVCLTNRQWAELSRDQSALAREFAQENTSRPGGQ